jgi:hypothetical protein
MNTAHDKILNEYAGGFFTPDEKLSVSDWAEKHLVLSARISNIAGPYTTKLTPYVREPLECFSDNTIRRVTMVWGAQTAKTTTILAGLAYRLAEKPCPTLWVMPTEPLARSFSESRWLPMVADSPILTKQKPADVDKIKLTEQHFNRMSVWFVGSNSPANLASRSISLLLLDEVDKFANATTKEAGALQLAEARVATYPNHLVLATSTPTVETGTIWSEWLKGDMRFYFVPCPHCGFKQKLSWPQVKWDEKAKVSEDNYDFVLVKNSAYYECENCHDKITDGQKTAMLRGGEWRATNHTAEAHRRSYHLNGLYAPWMTFGGLAVKFIQDKYNGLIGLQDFVNRVLAEPWVEQEEEGLEIGSGGYRMGELKDEEKVVMGVDVQEAGGFHTWVVVRAWAEDGKSRLIWAGRIESWGDLREKQLEFKIENDSVFIDSGAQTRDVYEQCCIHGWIALFGSDQAGFPIRINNTKIMRPFVRIANGDPLSGKAGSRNGWKWKLCPVWRWSNPTIKDVLNKLLKQDGFAAMDAPEAWHKHLRSEVKKLVRSPLTGRAKIIWKQIGKNVHLRDCECMCIVGAALHKRLNLMPANIEQDLTEN